MIKTSIALATITLTASMLGGCTDETETRNMEQIYAEQGIPVTVETVTATPFSRTLEYTAVLSGLKESSAYATIDDKIDHILYDVGDVIEKDAVVISFPTDNPAANYHQTKVSFENAQTTFNRMQDYYETGGLSRQDFDNARAAYDVARANWDAVRQSVEVKAPISGVLTRVNFSESENVAKEDEIFAISQIDNLKARLWVPEKQISEITVGQNATARWNGFLLGGHVVQVDMSMNRERQAFGVVAEFSNPDLLVKCGVTSTVTIETYQAQAAVVVKRENLISRNNNTYVFVAEQETARLRQVTPGHNGGLNVEITDGLEIGEELIVEGIQHIEEGKKIRISGANSHATSE